MIPAERFRVLVVDGDPLLRRMLHASLRSSGFAVEEARTAEEALEVMRERTFDLALLYIDTPGANGVNLCRQMRALGESIGIVMVSARDAEKDMVQALEAGADDYISKPFRLGELTARCHALLRRIHGGNAAAEASISVGNLELDLGRRLLRKAGKVVHLTPTEFNLLAFLMKNQGIPLTHAKLLRTIWGRWPCTKPTRRQTSRPIPALLEFRGCERDPYKAVVRAPKKGAPRTCRYIGVG